MQDLILANELDGLEESKAQQIEAVFHPMVEMLKGFEGEYDRVMQMEQSEEKTAEAKKIRIAISKVRIEADKVRKAQKEEYLRAGNAIQGVYNILKFAVAEKEQALKDIEDFYANIEKQRLETLHSDREIELLKYDSDSAGLDLSSMTDVVWSNYIAGVKANYEAVKEAERKAEEERIEREKKEKLFHSRSNEIAKYGQFGALEKLTIDTSNKEYIDLLEEMQNKKSIYEKEQEAIRKENELLKAEAEEKEVERKKVEEKERKDREAKEVELKKERDAREKLEKEQKERELKEAEEKRKSELAPDKDKLLNLSTGLLARLNTLSSPEAKQAIQEASYILSSAAEKMT